MFIKDHPDLCLDALEKHISNNGANLLSCGYKCYQIGIELAGKIQLDRERIGVKIFEESPTFITIQLNPWPFDYAWSINGMFSYGDNRV